MRFEIVSAVWVVLICFVTADDIQVGDCTFEKHNTYHSSMDALGRIAGKRYSVTHEDGYSYEVGICTPALPSSDSDYLKFQTAAVVQRDEVGQLNTRSIGDLKKAAVMAGSNWISLEYAGGDPYSSHCTREGKRSVIMISCGSSGELVFIEENKNKSMDCYYLFEVEDQAACPQTSNGLSVGSILVIIFFLLISLYIVGGFVYQRFIAGAKGLEQMPNYSFWKDFGNLQADGCDLICRSGSRHSANRREYRGVGDDQLQANEEEFPAETDEHLLPM